MNACSTMLPRLEAEEALASTDRITLGVGRYERTDAQRLVNRWMQAAHGGRRQVTRATPELLPAMGIGYQVVPKR